MIIICGYFSDRPTTSNYYRDFCFHVALMVDPDTQLIKGAPRVGSMGVCISMS